jgi:hypothetical protein
VILRNNRWRCDHGWDIDLDDGSTNYEIRNNLCLNGGLKNREGFFRVVENNIIVENSFHPHVWFLGSEDVFRRNIVFRGYQPIRVARPWGKEVDYNLLHTPGSAGTSAAVRLQGQSGRDEHSLTGDALFVNPEKGDYRVKPGSPALALGFQNFPMDQFGVGSPRLKAIARTPKLPGPEQGRSITLGSTRDPQVWTWLGARMRNVLGFGEVSAAGLPAETGVLLLEVPEGSAAAKAGLRKDDVVVRLGGSPVGSLDDLKRLSQSAAGNSEITVFRAQREQRLRLDRK